MLDMLKDGAGNFRPEFVSGTQASMGMKAGPMPEPGEAPPPQEMGPFHPLPRPPVPQRTQFATGAQRDTQDGKPNFYECLSPFAQWRYGMYMADNAVKYGADNWTKGIPIESYIKSLERHLLKLKMELKYGKVMERGTDHAAAILFNIQGLMHEQEMQKWAGDDDDDED
jgi:hypothetical protein